MSGESVRETASDLENKATGEGGRSSAARNVTETKGSKGNGAQKRKQKKK